VDLVETIPLPVIGWHLHLESRGEQEEEEQEQEQEQEQKCKNGNDGEEGDSGGVGGDVVWAAQKILLDDHHQTFIPEKRNQL